MHTTPHNVGPDSVAAASGLRCGLVVPSLDLGGLEEVVAMLALKLPAQGIQPFVLCTHAGGLVADRLRAAGAPVTIGDGSRRTWRAWSEDVRPDVIASHCASAEAVRVLSRAAPIVEVIHNTNVWFSPSDWAAERTKAGIARRLVACSAGAAAYQMRHCGPRAFTIIPNGVDDSRLLETPRATAREALGLGPDDIVFVHVGRFSIQKNLLGLIDAFGGIANENRHARLLLVGCQAPGSYANPADEVYAESVASRARALVDRGQIRILPYTSDPGLPLSASDAYVSNAFFEGWSLAATEAMWLGLPALLSDCGSARELIGDHGERGVLIPNPAGDPATLDWQQVVSPAAEAVEANRRALSDALRAFVEHRDEWARRAPAIRKVARERWSSERVVAAYSDLLQATRNADPTPARVLRHYWNVAGARPRQFVLPLMLVLLAGACEFASFSLLIPLTRAVGTNSFAFLESSRAFGWIGRLVPETLASGASRDIALIVTTIGLVILGRFGKLFFEYLRGFYVVARTERYRASVATETFRRVLGFGRQYFDRRPIGHSDAAVNWSGSVVELMTAAEEVARYSIGLLVKAGVMVAISLPLSVAFAVTLPFVSWIVTVIDRRVAQIAAAGMEADRNVRSRIIDILGSIPLVKVNSQEREAAATYAAALDEARDVRVRRERITSLRYPVEEMIILLVMLAVQGVVMTLDGGFSPGELAAFGAFLLIVQQSLPDYKFLSWFRLRLAEEWPQLKALAELFSDDGKHIVPSGPRRLDGLREGIEFRNLRFGYEDGSEVLRGVNAMILAGKVTAIVGRTGAGKTTLVDLIARLYDCPRGTVLLDGTDIREFSVPSIHARLGMVSQDVWLLNGTLRENLTFGLDRPVSDQELLGALDDVDLREFFETLRDGLDTSIGDRGVRLSGGQRQRVALSRALLRDPEILILDEATSALDSEVEQRVARSIQRRSAGRTLIMIAHRLSTIRDADAILVLENGEVVDQGTWDELLGRDGAFQRLHDAQLTGDHAMQR